MVSILGLSLTSSQIANNKWQIRKIFHRQCWFTQFHADCFLEHKFCGDLVKSTHTLKQNAEIRGFECTIQCEHFLQDTHTLFVVVDNLWICNWTKCIQTHRFSIIWCLSRFIERARFGLHHVKVAATVYIGNSVIPEYVHINDELQMFAKFVSAKLENSTITSHWRWLWLQQHVCTSKCHSADCKF